MQLFPLAVINYSPQILRYWASMCLGSRSHPIQKQSERREINLADSLNIHCIHTDICCLCFCSDITWALWVLKSLATGLFVQQLVKANNRDIIRALHYWPFVEGIHLWPVPIMWKVICVQLIIDSNVEGFSMFWHHHVRNKSHVIIICLSFLFRWVCCNRWTQWDIT